MSIFGYWSSCQCYLPSRGSYCEKLFPNSRTQDLGHNFSRTDQGRQLSCLFFFSTVLLWKQLLCRILIKAEQIQRFRTPDCWEAEEKKNKTTEISNFPLGINELMNNHTNGLNIAGLKVAKWPPCTSEGVDYLLQVSARMSLNKSDSSSKLLAL